MLSRGQRIMDEEINELISKLQALLPESRRKSSGRKSASKLLKDMCSYIKCLQEELEGLSECLSELMATMDSNIAQAEIVRSLLTPWAHGLRDPHGSIGSLILMGFTKWQALPRVHFSY